MGEGKTKGFFKSWGILGSLGSIGSLLAIFTQFREFYDSIPPELVTDTKMFFSVTVVAFISSIFSLIGRWRATTKIKGIL